MAQKSMLWETQTGTGDGIFPYSQKNAGWFFSNFYVLNKATMGVIQNADNELEVTGSSSPLAVDTGLAAVYDFRYINDASKNIAITTPSNGDTGGRIVLQADWSANTVRAVAISSDDGVSTPPALTQTIDDTWEVPLASFVIDTSGNIWTDGSKATAGVTDERVFNQSPLSGTYLIGEIDGDGSASEESFDIPSWVNHLKVVIAGQSGEAATSEEIGIRFNDDADANYRHFFATVEFAGSVPDINESYTAAIDQTEAQVCILPGSTALAEAMGFTETMIPNIQGTSNYKSMLGIGYYRTAAASPDNHRLFVNAVWRNTAAITSITILDTAAANFPTGFKASVYGWR